MTSGDLVTIVGKFNTKIKTVSDELRVGTFWTHVAENRVLVLLSNGDLHLAPKYEVIRVDTVVQSIVS